AFFQALWTGSRAARRRQVGGDRAGGGERRAGRPAVFGARPVRPGGRSALLGLRHEPRRRLDGGLRAARALGRGRPLGHRRQRRRFAPGRPDGAPQPAVLDAALLRARAGDAAVLPRRHPVGPLDEGHAGRHGQPVRPVAHLLPRPPRHLHRRPRAAAAHRGAELAARAAAGRAGGRLLRDHRLGHPEDREGAEHGGEAPDAPGRQRAGRALQRGRGAGLHPPEQRGAAVRRHRPPSARPPVPGAELVGRGVRADPGRQYRNRHLHLRARHRAAPGRQGDGGRDRHLHGLRLPADRQAGGGGRLRVAPAVPGALHGRILRGHGLADHRAGEAGRHRHPPRRGLRVLRARRLRLPRRAAHPGRRGVPGAARPHGRVGRPDRRRQVHRHGTAPAPVGPGGRAGHAGRPRPPRHRAGEPAPQHRRGVPGEHALQPHHQGQPAHRPRRRHAGRDRERLPDGRGARLHHPPAPGLRHAGGRARLQPVRRPAPAPGHRPRPAEGPAGADPGRGDQRAGRGDRGAGAAGVEGADDGPHHLHHRPPPIDRARRRRDPRVRGGPHRRARHLRQPGGARRPLRRPGPHAAHRHAGDGTGAGGGV
ncbi:MAG: Beta-(1--_2)glucan export ATP-binding/permease protein NdvA, partial [uncultured Acetobacteraceae bacterium]